MSTQIWRATALKNRIRRILTDLGYTPTQAAQALEIHLSTVSKYLSGDREPDAAMCLLLAALARDPKDRQFFVKSSGLALGQLAKIFAMLAETFGQPSGRPGFVSIEVPENQLSLVHDLMEYFQTPAESISEREAIFRSSIAAVLKVRKHDAKP